MDGGARRRRRQMGRGALALGELLLLGLTLLATTGLAWEPPDDCLLPCVVGRCRAAFPRWWYNATSQVCQEFIFGGCRGNANNFQTKEECFWTCVPGGEEERAGTPLTSQRGAERPATEAAPSSSHRHHPAEEDTIRFQEHCAAPRVTGHCRASFPRWFFNMETRTCEMFTYGGCGGNKNNYLLQEDCLRQCAAGGSELPGEPGEDPSAHGSLFPDSAWHSTRAVILAVLLALLLASLVLVVVRICHRGREHSLSTVWSTLDDKELLMSSGYTL